MRALVRAATAADAPGIGEVHVRTWQAAYAGQLPADFLDALSVERATRNMARRLADLDQRAAVLVAECDGEIVGFVTCGPPVDEDAPEGRGQVYAIYVAAGRWRGGIGRMLHDAALESLRDNGFTSASLWVLRSNTSARDFYTTVGWMADDDAERTEDFNGTLVSEVRYTRLVP